MCGGGKCEPYREPGQEKKAGKEVTVLGGDIWKCLGREKCMPGASGGCQDVLRSKDTVWKLHIYAFLQHELSSPALKISLEVLFQAHNLGMFCMNTAYQFPFA